MFYDRCEVVALRRAFTGRCLCLWTTCLLAGMHIFAGLPFFLTGWGGPRPRPTNVKNGKAITDAVFYHQARKEITGRLQRIVRRWWRCEGKPDRG